MTIPEPLNVEDVIPGEHVVLSSRGRTEGFFANLYRHSPLEVEATTDEHIVTVYLDRKPARFRQGREGRTHEGPFRNGEVRISPSRVPEFIGWDEEILALDLYLEPRFVRTLAESSGVGFDGAEVLPVFRARDPHVERIGLSLKEELETGGLGGELYAGALANALAVHLLREHSSLGERARRRAAREPKGGLSGRQLGKVLDFIGDNLASSGELSLAEIAAQANTSPHHFSRLFKESTGVSPHQYVIRERVERAKGLLMRDVPIGEVARMVGFSSQAHLTRHFKRLTGATPARYRRY
jgi:AraC family transcriptional regulator